MGIDWCPGCGLGHSISWLFHGNLNNSFHAHWLGFPAVAVILSRIYTLLITFVYPVLWPQAAKAA